MSEFDRKAEFRRYLVWFAIALSVVIFAELTHVRPSALFDSEGITNAGHVLSGFLRPDLSPDFLVRILSLSLESLFVGLLGTLFALGVGTVLALAATRIPNLPDPPGRRHLVLEKGGDVVRWLARFLLGFFRSIPEIVWAYIFVQLLGLGPGAAVLAIGLTVGGSIGKLYAELAEAVDPRIVGGLRSAGASRWAVFLYGVLPQVRRQWVAYALFRMECNIRTGTILGVVGAGGLGSEIALSIRYFEFDKLATALIAVLVFVITLEIVSAYLRRSPVKWAAGFAAVGGIASFIYLDIPWLDLFDGGGIAIVDPAAMSLSAGFVNDALHLVTQTLLMAWIATIVAAVFAFFLAPLATNTLITRSYLPDTYAKRGFAGWSSRVTLWNSRLVLQITRAMPELMLALIFVVWVGPGAFAGILAIAVHNIGVLGRLYTDVYEEVEQGPPRALQAAGAAPTAVWLFGVLPQVFPRLLAFTLYRFEVNVRATATVGFVGAGGIGDALHTSISLFHVKDLTALLFVMLVVVTVVDYVGDRARARILCGPRKRAEPRPRACSIGLEDAAEMACLSPTSVQGQAAILLDSRNPFKPAQVADVSTTGMWVATDRPYPPGFIIQIAIALPNAGRPHLGHARVARTGEHTYREGRRKGMFIEFINPAPLFLAALDKLGAYQKLAEPNPFALPPAGIIGEAVTRLRPMPDAR